MTIQLKRLKAHHRGMARAQVAFGLRVGELADKFGLTPQQVTNITNSELYKAEVSRIESLADENVAKLDEDLMELAQRAVEVIAQDIYQPEATQHRTRVAFSILDRTGYHKKEAIQDNRKQTINIVNFAPEPGEDPETAIGKLKEVRKLFKEMKEEEEDGNE